MGHEDEGYASVPPAINLSKNALDKALEGREESSLIFTKGSGSDDKNKAEGGDNNNIKVDDDVKPDTNTATKTEEGETEEEVPPTKKEEGTDEEGGNDASTAAAAVTSGGEDKVDEEEVDKPVKPTKVLKTYEARRQFIVKVLDFHRHSIGGGRSGRRGRAECTAFFRYVLEILDDQYNDAIEEAGGDIDVSEIRGKYIKGLSRGKKEDDSESSSEEEFEQFGVDEDDDIDEEEEEEEEEEESEAEPEPPKKRPRGRPKGFSPNKPWPMKDGTMSVPSSKSLKSKKKPPVLNEEEFFDQHNDYCEVCNQPGELLCCATCNLVFHVNCALPKLTKEPPDDWSCSYCWAAGVRGGKKDGKGE